MTENIEKPKWYHHVLFYLFMFLFCCVVAVALFRPDKKASCSSAKIVLGTDTMLFVNGSVDLSKFHRGTSGSVDSAGVLVITIHKSEYSNYDHCIDEGISLDTPYVISVNGVAGPAIIRGSGYVIPQVDTSIYKIIKQPK